MSKIIKDVVRVPRRTAGNEPPSGLKSTSARVRGTGSFQNMDVQGSKERAAMANRKPSSVNDRGTWRSVVR